MPRLVLWWRGADQWWGNLLQAQSDICQTDGWGDLPASSVLPVHRIMTYFKTTEMYYRYQESGKVYPRYQHISPTTFLVFATLFIFSTFALANRIYSSSNDDQSFDLLIFTQNWPVSVCRKYIAESKTNKCFQFPNNTWTIHGLWPTKKGKIGPNFCNKSRSFIPEAIYGIEDELQKYWSPVEQHKSKYIFWAHEWEKHGTCAAVLPDFSTEFDYFYKVLQLQKQYTMNDILAKAGISPDKTYNVTTIWDGVKSILKKNPQVICYEEKGNVSLLLEIRICLDKSLNPADCDGTVVGMAEPITVHWRRRSRARRAASYHNLTNCKIEIPVEFPPGVMKNKVQEITAVNLVDSTPSPLTEKIKIINFLQWFTG